MNSPDSGIDAKWERLQELFSRAVDLSFTERNAFVERETADDPQLREELLGLLACDTGKSTGPLTTALGAALDATTRDQRRALIGKVVGNYKLTSVLGHGGTGTVYLAERADRQYSAQVAVKIVDTATVQGELGMRFRAERQILASLNHPNIARLLDAGETDEGQPFLIMEYVHGEPVDRYCDRQQLDLEARLNLFLDICGAVQYAHQNLIVHRDLKPANILVTVEGSAKLLDFGIAKLLDVGDSASVLALTRMNDRLLTPEYASPEQILGRPVTTASDVYALGVVLYELLTGLRPYVVAAAASQLELERSICVTDPHKPSSVVKRAIDAGPVEGQSNIAALAAARQLIPDRLQRRLQGDIDAIVMRALRKEPQHRYGSIEQLTADIRRFLAREPVQARQGNWLYYSQRFARRHTLGVSASATFVAMILGFAVTMSVQRQRIAQERDRATQESARAEKVSQFMLDVFAAADPFENEGKAYTARDLLDQASRTIRGDLSEQPEVRARLFETMGKAYRRQGQLETAVGFYQDALRIHEQSKTPIDTPVASILTEMAAALNQLGRLKESDEAMTKALRIAQENKSQETIAGAELLASLGQLEHVRGNTERAEQYLNRGLELTQRLSGLRSVGAAAILSDLSNLRMWRDDLDGAEQAAREAVSIYRETTNEYHPDRIMASHLLARLLNLRGRTAEAAELLEQTLTSQRLVYGEFSSKVSETMSELASVRAHQGQLSEAERLTIDALSIEEKARGASHHASGYLLVGLAQIHLRQRRLTEAESEVRRGLEIFATTLPPDHQYVASAEYISGEIFLSLNRLADAESMLTASMNRWKRTEAPAWRAARSAGALGEALHRLGRSTEAEKYLLEGYHKVAFDTGADQQTKQRARERIARFYVDTGQRDKLNALDSTTKHDGTAAAARPN
jgi:serine/threonine protein kinase